MDLDTARIRDLLDKRDAIDQELQSIFGKEKKPLKCSLCGSESHTARTCPSKKENPA